ncbi:hypothetical protein K6Q96_21725 [Grimontia kaedaensis]|uniref:DUF805 domain-containing protein n=1 Tax=Grimontia kaedaensis TaxID=2872157 RepID=A0ABY4WZC5_9GAMM|nr:hypothetical protein [Grimontia kaedaensis]USH04359.1 hypothetical protein K6Q96_21725 [Grimontia kaedaensis]
MRCSSCGGDFPAVETSVIDSSRYCVSCKQDLFAPSRKKVSEKLVETLEKKEKTKVKTDRLGRVEFFLYSVGTWLVIPAAINSNIPKHSDLRMFQPHFEASTHLSISINFEMSWLWLIPILLSLRSTMGRVKDLNWHPNTSFVLWTPFTSLALFLIPGSRGENQYGLKPMQPSMLNTTLAILGSIPFLVLTVLLGLAAKSLIS